MFLLYRLLHSQVFRSHSSVECLLFFYGRILNWSSTTQQCSISSIFNESCIIYGGELKLTLKWSVPKKWNFSMKNWLIFNYNNFVEMMTLALHYSNLNKFRIEIVCFNLSFAMHVWVHRWHAYLWVIGLNLKLKNRESIKISELKNVETKQML